MFAVVLIFVSHDPRGQFPEKDVDRRSQVLPCSKNKCRFNHYHVAAENLTPPANWAQANVDSIIMWTVAARDLTPPANWAHAKVDSIIMCLQKIICCLQTGLRFRSSCSQAFDRCLQKFAMDFAEERGAHAECGRGSLDSLIENPPCWQI